jgi:hypothetical protein
MTLNKQFNYTFNFLQKIKFSELNVIDFSKSVKKKNSRKKKK